MGSDVGERVWSVSWVPPSASFDGEPEVGGRPR